MSVCPLCGKRVMANKGNATIVDGQLIHKNCNKNKRSNSLSPQEKQDRKELFDAISQHLETHPRGYVAETGLNFKKVGIQVSQLKKQGYSYKDQLYALHRVVEKQQGFWGYTSVVNNIAGIIAKRDKMNQTRDKFISKQHNTDKVEKQPYDLSKLIDSESEDW